MGVLSDGEPYLSTKMLAKVCGVSRQVIIDISKEWVGFVESDFKPKNGSRTDKILARAGHSMNPPYREVGHKNSTHNCWSIDSIIAVLQYYAFDTAKPTDEAKIFAGGLMRHGLVEFIYKAADYTPEEKPQVLKLADDIISGKFEAGANDLSDCWD